ILTGCLRLSWLGFDRVCNRAGYVCGKAPRQNRNWHICGHCMNRTCWPWRAILPSICPRGFIPTRSATTGRQAPGTARSKRGPPWNIYRPWKNISDQFPTPVTSPHAFANIQSPMKHIGENVVRIEAEALRALADRIGGPMAEAFNRAIELLCACHGRVVVTGMGKSGIIARKIAATLNSTGTPALFMHPVEAVHGDLGMVVRGDVVLALSASGESEEILRLLATIKRLRVPLISMTGDSVFENKAGKSSAATRDVSTLAEAAEVALDWSVV